jgi:hypothetical protein
VPENDRQSKLRRRLWNDAPDKMGTEGHATTYESAVLEQYRLYVEMADRNQGMAKFVLRSRFKPSHPVRFNVTYHHAVYTRTTSLNRGQKRHLYDRGGPVGSQTGLWQE